MWNPGEDLGACQSSHIPKVVVLLYRVCTARESVLF